VLVDELSRMGFSRAAAEQALRKTNGDLRAATNVLLDAA